MVTPLDIIKDAQAIGAVLTLAIEFFSNEKLSNTDLNTLDSLAAKYKNCFKTWIRKDGKENEDIPLEFQYTPEKFSRIRPSDRAIESISYESNYGNNQLTPYGRAAIKTICEYQKSRKDRLIGKGTLWDCTGLFCHFLKNIFVQITHYKLTDKSTLTSISQLLKFIESVEFDEKLFPPGNLEVVYDETMRQTIARVNVELKKMLEVIESQIARLSAREIIDQLSDSMFKTFDYGIDIAMRAITTEKIADRISLTTITEFSQREIEANSEKVIRQYIYRLALVYPLPGRRSSDENSYIMELKDGEKWRGCSLLTPNKDLNIVKRFINFEQPLTAKTEGISKEDERAIENYMKFLAMLERLAKNAKYVAQAFKLAGDTGNIGIFYQMGESTKQLSNIILATTNSLRSTFALLVAYLEGIHNRARLNADKSEDAWLLNVEYIYNIKDLFYLQLDNVNDCCRSIQKKYEDITANPEEYLKQIEEEVEGFKKGISYLASHISKINIGYHYTPKVTYLHEKENEKSNENQETPTKTVLAESTYRMVTMLIEKNKNQIKREIEAEKSQMKIVVEKSSSQGWWYGFLSVMTFGFFFSQTLELTESRSTSFSNTLNNS